MLKNITLIVFAVDVIILYILLAGIVWSIAFPKKRIWPPPQKKSWQHRLVWTCFYLVFLSNALLFFLDWNSWILFDPTRFILGTPLIVIGVLLLLWGMNTLGVQNTSGVRDGLVQDGPHRFTRNPQYLGDMLLFVGLSLVANSLLLWVTHGLLILVFLITPFVEEIWLEEQYGDDYRSYERMASRFL